MYTEPKHRSLSNPSRDSKMPDLHGDLLARQFGRAVARRMSSYVNERIFAPEHKQHKSNEVNKMKKEADKGQIDWVKRILGSQHGKT